MKALEHFRRLTNHSSTLGIYSVQTEKSFHCSIRIGDFAYWKPDFSNVKSLSYPDTSKTWRT